MNYLKLKEQYLLSEAYQYKIEELAYFRGKSSMDEAVKDAITAEKNGVLFPHQYRLRKIAIDNTYRNVDKIISGVKNSNSFEDILTTICRYKSKGYGRLASMDFAFRLSVAIGIRPEYVYVQSGSYNGSKLLGLNVHKDKFGGFYIDKCDIPIELQEFDTIELENFLCWYAHEKKLSINA